MKKLLYSKPLAIGLLLISFITYLAMVLNFEPRIDDAFLGEQLYWLLKDGHVRSELMSQYRNIGIENLWTVFHKGTIYFGFIWSKLFGWSIYTLHLGSIIASLLFLWMLYRYVSREEKYKTNPNFFAILASVCCLFYYFTWNSSRFRPEILELALGFFAYLQLSSFLKDEKNYHWILGAIAAGLSMLAHLNGMIVIAAGCILLVFNKKWVTAFFYGAVASLVFFATYFADVFLLTDFSYFWFQFTNDPALNSSDFTWYAPLLRIFEEWRRYFHADVNTVFSLPFVAIFALTFKSLWKQSKNMIVYMLTMMIILSFYTYSKKAIFLLPAFPYMAILMVEGVYVLLEKEKKNILQRIGVFLFIIYFPASIYLMGVKIHGMYTSNVLRQNREIGKIIGENNRVMSDEMFIFHQIKHQESILNIEQFRFFRSFHGIPNYSFDQLIDECIRRDMDYFIIRFANLNGFRKHFEAADNRFNIEAQTDDYVILAINKQ